MQEYFNVNATKIKMEKPREIETTKGDMGFISISYEENDMIAVLTPPIKCVHVKRYMKNQELHKAVLEFQLAKNEWRFTSFLQDITDTCKTILHKNGKKWFGFAFSDAIIKNCYRGVFKDDYDIEPCHIQVKLSREYLKKYNKDTIKDLLHKDWIVQLIFLGILIENGEYVEYWYIDRLIKPNVDNIELMNETYSEGEGEEQEEQEQQEQQEEQEEEQEEEEEQERREKEQKEKKERIKREKKKKDKKRGKKVLLGKGRKRTI